ncbi:MAG: hypothetical protein N2167_00500 [Flavobacteriales bacterium]|nr:hypothetical protein [Flavobacteriales bacterium]
MNQIIQDLITLQREFDQAVQLKAKAIQKQEYLKATRQRVRERALLEKAKHRLKELDQAIASLPEADQKEYLDFSQQARKFFSMNMLEQLTAINQEKARLEYELEKLQQQKKQLLSEYKFQQANKVREHMAEISEKLEQLATKANRMGQIKLTK